MSDEQRRRAPRVASTMMVWYRGGPQAAWKLTNLRDFSRTGARFVAEESLEAGLVITLRFGLPLFPQPVEIPAKIIWQKSLYSGRLQMMEYGITFTSVDGGVQTVLDVAIEHFRVRQPKPS